MESLIIDSIFAKIEENHIDVSNLYPSEWSEQNRVMTKDVSPIEGPFSYENSPYVKGIVDCPWTQEIRPKWLP